MESPGTTEEALMRILTSAMAVLGSAALLASLAACADTTPEKSAPSFACDKAATGSIEALVCSDPELSRLDREMARVYALAAAKAVNEHPATLKPTQRGWIKGRDDCWKNEDRASCVREGYVQRITELEARYRLVPQEGPFTFACAGGPADEVVVTYFDTEPRTLIAERGDRSSLMYQQPSASGTRYAGGDDSLWEHQGEALLTWGYGTPALHCRKSPAH